MKVSHKFFNCFCARKFFVIKLGTVVWTLGYWENVTRSEIKKTEFSERFLRNFWDLAMEEGKFNQNGTFLTPAVSVFVPNTVKMVEMFLVPVSSGANKDIVWRPVGNVSGLFQNWVSRIRRYNVRGDITRCSAIPEWCSNISEWICPGFHWSMNQTPHRSFHLKNVHRFWRISKAPWLLRLGGQRSCSILYWAACSRFWSYFIVKLLRFTNGTGLLQPQ